MVISSSCSGGSDTTGWRNQESIKLALAVGRREKRETGGRDGDGFYSGERAVVKAILF